MKRTNIVTLLISAALFVIIAVFIVGCVVFRQNTALASLSYYVDNTCQYNGNGQGQTCATKAGGAGAFNSLAGVSPSGNQSDVTLYLKAGQTYAGQFTLSAYGTAGHPFTVTAYGSGAKPKISGGASNVYIAQPYVVIDGLELAGATSRGLYILSPATNVTVKNCYIHNAADVGLQVYNADNNIIDGNVIAMNGVEGVRIVKGDTSHPTANNIISHNTIYKNLRYGVLTLSNGADYLLDGPVKIFGNETYNNSTGIYLVRTNNAEVYNNNSHDNGQNCQGSGDCTGEPYGLAQQSGSNNSFHDNVVTKNYNTGIGVYGDKSAPANNNRYYNNTITGTLMKTWQRDFDYGSWLPDSVGSHNYIYGNTFGGAGYNVVIDGDGDAAVTDNRLYNNTLTNGQGVLYTGAVNNWTFSGNVFSSSGTYLVESTSSGTVIFSGNAYLKNGPLVRYKSVTYTAANIKSLDSGAILSGTTTPVVLPTVTQTNTPAPVQTGTALPTLTSAPATPTMECYDVAFLDGTKIKVCK